MRTVKVFLIKDSLRVKTEIKGDSRRYLRAKAIALAEKLGMDVGSMSFL